MVEIYRAVFRTTLTAAITSASRPVTISVAATDAAFGAAGGVYSIAIYDFGTDANPTNFEALEVTSGGSTTSWVCSTESGWVATTHANGSQVIATVLTPRSINQPLTDHLALSDPHTQYVRKGTVTAKGDILVGTASATLTNLAVSTDGLSIVADSSQLSGVRWGQPTVLVRNQASLAAAASMTATPAFWTQQIIESAAAAATATSGTITTTGVTVARISPAGAITGVILQALVLGNSPIVTVLNEAVAANTVTFAASGTSNVADGASDVIAGLTARTFVWDSFTSLWYRLA
jgi:hypothetical protein